MRDWQCTRCLEPLCGGVLPFVSEASQVEHQRPNLVNIREALQEAPGCVLEEVRTVGVSEAFQLKEYHNMAKSQAANGAALVAQSHLIQKLMGLNDTLLFNYKDLKECFGQVCKDFPQLKMSFPVEMRPVLSGKLAEACMTMCTHMRRLTNSEMNFQEACRGLSDWQVRKLDESRRVGIAEKNEATPERTESGASIHQKREKRV